MEMKHEFVIPVPVDVAWDALLDVERVALCMPGATVTSADGDSFTGKVNLRIGPVRLTYDGRAEFIDKHQPSHTAVIRARGKETRSSGTATADVTASLHPEDVGTRVEVRTELSVTGKAAQFGRGVMVDVGNTLLGQFADNLAAQLAGGATDPAGAEMSPPTAAPAPVPLHTNWSSPREVGEPGAPLPSAAPAVGPRRLRAAEEGTLDLSSSVYAAVAKRALPGLLAAGVIAVVLWRTLKR